MSKSSEGAFPVYSSQLDAGIERLLRAKGLMTDFRLVGQSYLGDMEDKASCRAWRAGRSLKAEGR